LRFSFSYRDVEKLLDERGLRADHVTVWRWGPTLRLKNSAARQLAAEPRRLRPTNDRWRVDETYIRVKSKWVQFSGLSTPPLRRSTSFRQLNATLQRLSASSGRDHGAPLGQEYAKPA
jgi:hypothetical protein